MTDSLDRRSLIKRAGAVAIVGGLAGCGDGGDGDDATESPDGGAEEPEDETTEPGDGTPTEGMEVGGNETGMDNETEVGVDETETEMGNET